MKKTLFAFLFINAFLFSFAQETYTINNETLVLKTEADGALDLLWNTIDGQYRYFVRTENGDITELKNTKGTSNKFQNEYRATLEGLTNGLPADQTKLTVYSLKDYVDAYNKSVDSSYIFEDRTIKLGTRLGVFGGLTNQPFVENPTNKSVTFFGAEFEIFDQKNYYNHAGFLNVRHSLDSNELPYTSTQLSLGYRYRFINKDRFSIYGQTKFATYTHSKTTITYENPNNLGTFITQDESGSSFNVPFVFGIGADIKVGDSGYIIFVYDSLFAAFVDSEGNFPVDFAIGYKFNL
ncbi:hypothetical protein [Lacinutrix salivirga]